MVNGDVDWVGEAVVCIEVGRDVDRVGWFVVDSCFVEGVIVLLRDEAGGDIGAEDGGEGRVICKEVDGGGVLESVELIRVGNRGCESEEIDRGDCNHDGRGGCAMLGLTMRTGRAGTSREELKVFICISTYLHN